MEEIIPKNKLGRPMKDIVLTGNDRIKRWREKNREKEREKDRLRKQEKKEKMTEQELQDLQENTKFYQQTHRMNIKNNSSRQKLQGLKQKDKRLQHEWYENRKKRATTPNLSTPRVKQHRENQKLLVKMPFATKSVSSLRDGGSRWRKLASAVDTVDTLCTPTKKVRVVVKYFSPKSMMELLQSITPSPVSQDI